MEQLMDHSLKKVSNENLMMDYRGAMAVLVFAVKSGHGIKAAQADVRAIENEILRRLDK